MVVLTRFFCHPGAQQCCIGGRICIFLVLFALFFFAILWPNLESPEVLRKSLNPKLRIQDDTNYLIRQTIHRNA